MHSPHSGAEVATGRALPLRPGSDREGMVVTLPSFQHCIWEGAIGAFLCSGRGAAAGRARPALSLDWGGGAASGRTRRIEMKKYEVKEPPTAGLAGGAHDVLYLF